MRENRGPGAGVRAPRDSGTVTAELALLLPVVVLLLGVILAAAAAGVTQLQVTDAARAAARAAAIGESAGEVASTAHRLAGAGAGVEVGEADGFVVVTVSRPLPGILSGTWATATARAVPEPSPVARSAGQVGPSPDRAGWT